MQDRAEDLLTFAAAAKKRGIRDVVLLGMGGSSLGPEVLRATFGPSNGFPRLWVLDSTIPGWIQQVTQAIDPARSLFILASKSGGTIEVMSLFAHFWELVHKTPGHQGGEQFIAVTDPGTGLEKLAAEHGFWRTFTNPPDIGGRYSVLSYFGLVPAALMGIDVARLLTRAITMAQACRTQTPLERNPGADLGATMASLAQAGRNKITLISSPQIAAFGLWAEQLLAESTGKEGTGLIPVANEPIVSPTAYGTDRLFVYLRLKGDQNRQLDRQIAGLARHGHPVLTLALQDRYDLAGNFSDGKSPRPWRAISWGFTPSINRTFKKVKTTRLACWTPSRPPAGCRNKRPRLRHKLRRSSSDNVGPTPTSPSWPIRHPPSGWSRPSALCEERSSPITM